jgi:hypothetical protein
MPAIVWVSATITALSYLKLQQKTIITALCSSPSAECAAGVCRFVWGKKIERDLLKGADVREFTAAAQQRKHEERMVSSSTSCYSWYCRSRADMQTESCCETDACVQTTWQWSDLC